MLNSFELTKFKLNIQLFAGEGEGGDGDNGDNSFTGDVASTENEVEETVNEGTKNIFEMGDKGGSEGDSAGNIGEGGEEGEVNFSLDKIEGLNAGQIEAVKNSEEFTAMVARAKELGLNQEQFNYMAGTMVGNTMELLASHREELLKMNPPKEMIFEGLTDVAKESLTSGQMENFLLKVSSDDNILERVNEAFRTPEQYEILAQLAKGFASSQPGVSGDKGNSKGYNSKQDYFNDLNLHADLNRRAGEASKLGNPAEFSRLNAEAKQLMAEIKEKKKFAISSIFN